MTIGYCNDFIHFASKSDTRWFALASFYDRVCFGYLWKRSSFVCTKHYQCFQQNHTLDVRKYFFILWVQVTTKSLKHIILKFMFMPLKILKSNVITGHISIHRISIHINNIQVRKNTINSRQICVIWPVIPLQCVQWQTFMFGTLQHMTNFH